MAALVWALLMLVEIIRRAKLPSLGSVLSILSLFAWTLIFLGGGVIFQEIVNRQRGVPPPIDGLMYVVFCSAAGVALQGVVLVGRLVWVFTRKRT